MKKLIIIILLAFLLDSCTQNPLIKYAKDNNIELNSNYIEIDSAYCNFDTLIYYNNLVTKKTKELKNLIENNPNLPDDTLIHYRKYAFIRPLKNIKPNSLMYSAYDENANLICIYKLNDERIITKKQVDKEFINLKSNQNDLLNLIYEFLFT